ncbi:pyridoxal-phosphate dependent enzyme [Nonomuraea terrae]|uniref:Pyridoxal-phosphate dependent enzyme n=1 Tax=Nonomuraea terrae TaxID=2530383 RepID=A0A4R4XQU6_9ACTN|nr:pyridoxal-phosphate dependent enzyme [Nonomuraea terrae]TDD33444.1 pyridoxal-phosphate dependent enzyme [Nonomuraea terrae]
MEFANPGRAPYTERERELIGARHAQRARAHFSRRPGYRPTPVHTIPGFAGTHAAYVKDESARMGLGSFKALGGAYAVHLLAQHDPGGPPFVCASAGNHGLSVARGAAEAGVPCVVYLGDGVPEAFAQRLRALGADVRRSGGDYDASMAAALHAAKEHGWRLVADSSWEGYTDVPLHVMRGYGVLFDELADTGAAPTHVFVQAGVGGLAAAAAAYARDRWGEAPRIVVVEPEGAPCLIESARAGRPVRVAGAPTTLGRLDCHEPSLIAHRLLSRLADLYLTITDDQARAAARELAAHGVRLSACGAAGAAGLLALTPEARSALALDRTSRIFLVGTEGPVEPK